MEIEGCGKIEGDACEQGFGGGIKGFGKRFAGSGDGYGNEFNVMMSACSCVFRRLALRPPRHLAVSPVRHPLSSHRSNHSDLFKGSGAKKNRDSVWNES